MVNVMYSESLMNEALYLFAELSGGRVMLNKMSGKGSQARSRQKTNYSAFEENHRFFEPHITIHHELSDPRSQAVVTFIGLDNFKRIDLSQNFTFLSQREQMEYLKEAVRRDYFRKDGEDPMFGRITHYECHVSPNTLVKLDPKGEEIV
jgi:hypothetical protein